MNKKKQFEPSIWTFEILRFLNNLKSRFLIPISSAVGLSLPNERSLLVFAVLSAVLLYTVGTCCSGGRSVVPSSFRQPQS